MATGRSSGWPSQQLIPSRGNADTRLADTQPNSKKGAAAPTPPPKESRGISVRVAQVRLRLMAYREEKQIPTKGLPMLIYRLLYGCAFLAQLVGVKRARPFIPRLSKRERRHLALCQIKRTRLFSCKVVALFSLKGGVGKTTLSKLLAQLWKLERRGEAVLVQDCNRDRGTLGDRGLRTTEFGIPDLIGNLGHVQTRSDFNRYATVTEEEGVLVVASSRPDTYAGTEGVTREEMEALHDVEARHFSLVYDDLGTSTDSPTNRAALNKADVVVIVTTPANDSVQQAIMTFAYLQKEYPEKARCAILVVNRCWPWTRLQAIRRQFAAVFGNQLVQNVGFVSMGFTLTQQLGRNVSPANVRSGVRVNGHTLNALIASRLTDGTVGEPELTHQEMLARTGTQTVGIQPAPLSE